MGLLEVSGEFAEWFPCRSVISMELLCSFVGVTFWCGCSVNFLCIFRAPHCGRPLINFFAKALLSLIVHFKGSFTYFYPCFVHGSQIFNVLQILLIFCISSYICVICVHNLKLCFFIFDNRV